MVEYLNLFQTLTLTQTIQTTITVYGNETGGSQTIPVTVTYVI